MLHQAAVVLGFAGVLAQGAQAGDEASARLSAVIVALLVLAAVITVATVVFWRVTRPQDAPERPAMSWRQAPEADADEARRPGSPDQHG
jgi:flagellar basal body-associated protein FliL